MDLQGTRITPKLKPVPIQSETHLNSKERMVPKAEQLERNSTLYKKGRVSDQEMDNYQSNPFSLHVAY